MMILNYLCLPRKLAFMRQKKKKKKVIRGMKKKLLRVSCGQWCKLRGSHDGKVLGDADIPNQGWLSLLTGPFGSDRGTNDLLVSGHCRDNSNSPSSQNSELGVSEG